jgi:inner membrane protein
MSEAERQRRWLSRPIAGVLTVLGLVLVLQAPIALVRELIDGRIETREEAVSAVVGTWGGAQSILGPRLVVPYRDADDRPAPAALVSLLPAVLVAEGDVNAHALRRGLFTVPVYTAEVALRGRFDPRELTAAGIDGTALAWDRARLVIEVSDPSALAAGASATWEGGGVDLLPGIAAGVERRGIHANVPMEEGSSGAFEIHLALRGSEALWFAPFGRETDVRIASNWPHPAFEGAWLPVERRVDDAGFAATWRVPFLGRDYPQSWEATSDPWERVVRSRFGVDLVTPVDPYRMAERSTKYAALFLLATLGALWLFDTMTGVRVHAMQYLLVGAGMCVFYLLELSLSEHIGFLGAYAIASAAVASMVGFYARAVLGSWLRGAALGGAVATLYGYLLAVLSLERYALLAGSLALFVALAAVMYVTRWVDWDRVVRAGPAPAA